MSEIRSTLDQVQRRVSMPEPAMERLLRRRERKKRNERIAAAAMGLAVAAAGVVGAFVTLRVTGGTKPASEAGTAAAAEGGGFVLPTVAIWTAVVVLGLSVLAAVRLRRRLRHVGVEAELGGREPGGAAAPVRRPAAVPGIAPSKGGQMDSRSKTPVGIPQTEMPEIRLDDGKRRRTNRWLVAAVVVLAGAVLALGSLALVDLTGDEGAAAVPTPDPRTATVDALAAAWSGTDSSALEEVYAEDAVFTTTEGAVYEGRSAIFGLKESMGDFQVARVSTVVGQRKYAAAVMRLENAYGHAYLLTVWKFNADGMIVSQQDFYGGS